jgi:hypothetical protein
MVVDEPDAGAQPSGVEGLGPAEADLLFRREEELDPGVWAILREDQPSRLEQRRDGGLVVGPEDRPARIAKDAVLDHRLERPSRRHGVEVSAEEDRQPAIRARGLETAEQVARVRADLSARVVLGDMEPEPLEVTAYAICDLSLGSRRAGNRSQLGEEPDDVRRPARHGPNPRYRTTAGPEGPAEGLHSPGVRLAG